MTEYLLFAGQGIQRKGMGGDLFDRHPDLVAAADEILGYSIADLCLRDPERRLRDTRYAQPAVFVVNALATEAHPRRARAADPSGAGFDGFAGHSLGEYNALAAAGVLSFAEGLRIVVKRAEMMARIGGGGMAAVIGPPAVLVERALRETGLTGVFVANRNADNQTAIAGDRIELKQAAAHLADLPGARVVTLNVSGPFHTPLMEAAAKEFEAALAEADFGTGRATVFSSVTAAPLPQEPAAVRAVLRDQIAAPVEWTRTVRALRASGDGVSFTEAYGGTLTALLDDIR